MATDSPTPPTEAPVPVDPPAGGETTTGTGSDATAGSGADTTGGSDSTAGSDTSTGGAETTAGADSTPGSDTLTPASYDALALPEGFTPDDTLMGNFKEMAATDKLAPESAQKYVDLFASALKAQNESAHTQFTSTQSTWKAEVKQLPEFRADAGKAEATIARILDEFGGPEVRQIMDITGAGNNPHMVKMLLKIGAELGEGTPTPPGNPSGDKGPKTLGQALYGNSK